MHHYLGQACADHVVSTENNGDNKYAFKLHKVFPDSPLRYFPGYGINDVIKIAEENNCTHIICDHPYMALTAMSVSRKLNIPWVLRSHNIESVRFKTLGKPWWPVMKKYEQYAMQKAHAIFFVTPEDAEWSVNNYNIDNNKCYTLSFAIDIDKPPATDLAAKKQLAEKLNIDADVPWLYFLGALDYKPNTDAINYILNEVKPRLDKQGIKYEILIAGKGMPGEIEKKIAGTQNVTYTGFVDDLSAFICSCNVMLNPVITGGGIKTKAVEALGYNRAVVSAESGAMGLIRDVCGDKLYVAPDHDWDTFAQLVTEAMKNTSTIPTVFYDTYYQGKITEKIISIFQDI